MNGPCGMYAISPHYEYPKTIEKPTCMYEISSIYATDCHPARFTSEAPVQPSGKEDKDLLKLEERQKRLINQLEELAAKLQQIKQQMTAVPAVLNDVVAAGSSSISVKGEAPTVNLPEGSLLDVVVVASPNCKLIALHILAHWLRQMYRVDISHHTHSSFTKPINKLPWESLGNRTANQSRSQQQIILTLIWKDVGIDPQLMVSPSQQHTAIHGEVNILRYLASLLLPSRCFHDPIRETEADGWLDAAHVSVLHGSSRERQAILHTLASHLEKRQFLVGSQLSIADVGMLGAILQTQLGNKLPPSIKRWLATCCSDSGVAAVLETLTPAAV